MSQMPSEQQNRDMLQGQRRSGTHVLQKRHHILNPANLLIMSSKSFEKNMQNLGKLTSETVRVNITFLLKDNLYFKSFI